MALSNAAMPSPSGTRAAARSAAGLAPTRGPTPCASSARRAARSPPFSATRAALRSSIAMTWFSAEPESAKPSQPPLDARALSTPVKPETLSDVGAAMRTIGAAARAAALSLAQASSTAKTSALRAAAHEIRTQTAAILAANERDLSEAKSAGVSAAFLDRLLLDPQRTEAIAKGLEEVAGLVDPV